MAVPIWARVVGGGMGAVARGLQQIPELVDKEEELAYKRAERPLSLEESQLRLKKLRQEIDNPRPYVTPYGIYQRDPQTGQYTFEPLPEDVRKHAASAEFNQQIVHWLSYPPGTPERDYAEAIKSGKAAPGLNAQTNQQNAQTRQAALKQSYQLAKEKLTTHMAEVDKKIAAAKAINDQRTATALAGQKAMMERLDKRLDFELIKTEYTGDLKQDQFDELMDWRYYNTDTTADTRRETAGTKGTTSQAGSTDLPIDEAQKRLKELRTRPYFPGQSSERLADLERTIDQLKAQGKNNIGRYLTKKLQRLAAQLGRAAKRAHWDTHPRPQTTPPQSPPPGTSRPSSTGSSTPSGAPTRGPQGPTPAMVEAYTRFYTGMAPEEAEVDLKAAMGQDRTLQERGVPSPTTEAKQQAYSRVFPDRPLTLRIPTPSAAVPRTPQPQPQPATPPQGRTGTTPPQASPQAQVNPYVRYYESMRDQDLLTEQNRLKRTDPTGMDVLTSHRLAAANQVLRARRQEAGRKATPQHDAPAPPQATPEEVLHHYRAQYQHLSTDDLQQEANRLQKSDPFGLSLHTSYRLSVIHRLLTQRQAASSPRPVAPGPQEPD